jgi:hypothetical protein
MGLEFSRRTMADGTMFQIAKMRQRAKNGSMAALELLNLTRMVRLLTTKE